MKLAFGGDVMLGRGVADAMHDLGPDYPLEALAPVFRAADLGVVNLECAVTSNPSRWGGAPKAFYFRADPPAAGALRRAGIGAVSLANNHSLDYGREGLIESLELLEHEGVATFGAGRNDEEAARPRLLRVGATTVGFVGFTDHPSEFAAGGHRAGVAYLDLDGDPGGSLVTAKRGIDSCRRLGADIVVVSLHWGPNFDGEPAREHVDFAHALVDAGTDVLFGHSAHELLGIEVFHDRPILYGAGDLVDDYFVGERVNDRTLVYTITFEGPAPRRVDLSPCFIHDCRVVPAPPAIAAEITARVMRLSRHLGTTVQAHGDHPHPYVDVGARL